jgi:hypothetical protein
MKVGEMSTGMELEELAEAETLRADWMRLEDPLDAEAGLAEWVDAYEL